MAMDRADTKVSPCSFFLSYLCMFRSLHMTAYDRTTLYLLLQQKEDLAAILLSGVSRLPLQHQEIILRLATKVTGSLIRVGYGQKKVYILYGKNGYALSLLNYDFVLKYGIQFI